MKKKSSSNNVPHKTPSPPQPTNLDEALPPCFKFFEDLKSLTPREIVTKLFLPKLKNAPDDEAQSAVECIAGMTSPFSQFLDLLRVQVPDWVRAAAKKYWHYSGINLNEFEKGNPTELAKFLGAIEVAMQKPSELTPKIEVAASGINTLARNEAATYPAKKAGEFFSAMAKGEKHVAQLSNPPKRIRVFLLISTAWRHVESFENAGQLHRWLLKIDAFDGEITDSAETRKICRLVGLSFGNKAGKPPKKK